jgi:hypothetical protein
MAIMKEPTGAKVPWPPPASKSQSPYTVLPGESFATIATKLKIDPWDLIHFNFGTYKLEEVNWYLKHHLHCDKQTHDGKNFMFRGGETIYLPPSDTCPTPTENYPYSEATFDMVRRIAPLVRKYSKQYDVPPVAVAGSIADEYNTRTGLKAAVDWFQDDVWMNFSPNFAIQLNAWIIGGRLGKLGATQQDLGIGNIKLETAKRYYNLNRDQFEKKDMNYADLVDYLRTDEGTVHIAALVILRAAKIFHKDLHDYSSAKKEAVYVTYYKQGPTYLTRFQNALAADPAKRIEPGEGCRVLLQRKRFLKELKESD